MNKFYKSITPASVLRRWLFIVYRKERPFKSRSIDFTTTDPYIFASINAISIALAISLELSLATWQASKIESVSLAVMSM